LLKDMKYIREQIIRTVTTKKDLVDKEEIKDLLKRLSNASVDFIIEFRDSRTKAISIHKQARIAYADDSIINIISRRKKSMFKINGIRHEDILFIKLVTEKQNILLDDIQADDFDYIDLSDDGK